MKEESDRLAELEIVAAFARVRPGALGLSLGIVAGGLVFAATAVLLARATFGAAGAPVGPHLSLLGEYLPGYSVTWGGAVLGLGYGFLAGGTVGLAIAAVLNLHHAVYVKLVERRLRRQVILDGL
jgi:hypothetical protein